MSFASEFADAFNRKAHNDAIKIAALERKLARALRSILSLRSMLTNARLQDTEESPFDATGEDRRTTFGALRGSRLGRT